MDKPQLIEFAEKFLAAWNTQDVETTAGAYTDDVLYSDPNTKGVISGGADLRRYLKKLLGNWDMHYTLREVFPIAGEDGGAFQWHAKLARAGSEKSVEVDGMDLILIEGGRVKRNDVFFDRSVLAPLLK